MARFFEANVVTVDGEALTEYAATMGSAIQFCDRAIAKHGATRADVLDPFTGEALDVLALNAELARLAKLEKEQIANGFTVNPKESI